MGDVGHASQNVRGGSLAPIDEGNRVLVTNHDSFGYFADRYEFEVVSTVIPSGSTTEGVSAGELAELAAVVEHEGVPAIFAETTVSDELTQTLAAEVGGDIAVVELFTGSLGESGSGAETYVAMVRTNAQRIAGAEDQAVDPRLHVVRLQKHRRLALEDAVGQLDHPEVL